MTALEHGRQILDTMLGYLGFVVQIEEDNLAGRAHPSESSRRSLTP